MTNDERNLGGIRSSGLTNPPFGAADAFTLIELLIVIAIIIVLAGLVLSTVGYVQKKGARSRAETEIAAMSAAIESYKADNGIYPRGNANLLPTLPPYDTDQLNARANFDPSTATYSNTSLFLYEVLTGVTTGSRTETPSSRTYLTFKSNQLGPSDQSQPVQFIRDPFGNSYGYSTANQYDPTTGYNPTFDLWSTAEAAASPTPAPPATQQDLWIKNW
jgi:type II secretory pathway pseudopilin PulG